MEQSKKNNAVYEPMIIISASGMAETGRILHHLRNNVVNPKNTVMIVSWRAPNTLGRRLAERQMQLRIFGQIFEVHAEIATIGGLSAHAGQNMLLKYAMETQSTIKKLFLVHGEFEEANALIEKLKEKKISPIFYQERNEMVEI